MKRLIFVAAVLALAGCQAEEPTLPGTVVSVVEAEHAEEREESAKYYEHPLVPQVAWRVEVRLDDGSAVTVTQKGPRRHEAGERVRLLLDEKGALLL
jgi:outer membrane lipoprotein SlyB